MARKINVLQIVEDLKIGGIERIIAIIAQGLDKDKYNVFVWCLARGGEIASELEGKGMKVEVLGMDSRCSFLFFLRLYRKMRQANIDIFHSHGYTATTVGRFAAIFARIPVILTHIHTSFEKYTKRQIFVERFLNLFTDMIICCSQAVADSVRKCCKIKSEKLIVIYNGVNKPNFIGLIEPIEIKKKFNISPEASIIGCIASLTAHKGHRYLLEAAKIITKSESFKNYDLKFILVGDGPLRRDLEVYAKNLGISDNVIFTGLKKDIADILSIMDLVVLPSSQWEGLGISLIEAQSFGKPVIGTNIVGIPEIVKDNQTGILIPPKDSIILADAILSLLKDKEKSRRIGLAGESAYREKFTADIMLGNIDKLYSCLIASLKKGFKK